MEYVNTDHGRTILRGNEDTRHPYNEHDTSISEELDLLPAWIRALAQDAALGPQDTACSRICWRERGIRPKSSRPRTTAA